MLDQRIFGMLGGELCLLAVRKVLEVVLESEFQFPVEGLWTGSHAGALNSVSNGVQATRIPCLRKKIA